MRSVTLSLFGANGIMLIIVHEALQESVSDELA